MTGISILTSCNRGKEESLVISKTDSKEIIIPKYIPANQKLHDTINALDKLLWDAYNTGNDSIIVSYATEDFKFFRDNENPEWTVPARIITVWKKTPEGWRQSQQFSFHE